MAVQEYREFFLRNNQQVGGAKPDLETSYPTDYQVTDAFGNVITAKNRFLKDNFPSEDVFRKLFESITFKQNSEDTAGTENHGLVKIAVGQNIVNRSDLDIDTSQFTTVVVPSTLPIVSAGAGIGVTTLIRKVSDNSIVSSIASTDKELYYLDYVINNTQSVTGINITPFLVDTLNIPDGVIDANNSLAVVLGSHSVPAGIMNMLGDKLKYTVYWLDNSNDLLNGSFEVYIGNSSNINLCYPAASIQVTDGEVDKTFHKCRLDIDLEYNQVDGIQFYCNYRFYKVDAPSQVTTNGTATVFQTDTGETYLLPDQTTSLITIGDVFNIAKGNGLIDWSQPMFVHFRYLLNNGTTIGEYAHNIFHITGRNY